MHHHTAEHPRLVQAEGDVRRHSAMVPKVALVLGSGLGSFADTLEEATVIPYGEIGGMPVSTVAGHAGQLVLGKQGELPVVAMQGRVHLYEGHPAKDIVFGLRLMIHLGAKYVIITNAAGGCRPELDPGTLMVIQDHLNLTGTNALVGENEEALGVRFPDMSTAYDPELGDRARSVAAELGFKLASGVYAGLLGPSYETPAEIRMLQAMGADAVGMSTVLEVVAARHMGARVLGISCITNKAAGLAASELNHAEVKETAERVKERFVGLLQGVLRGLEG